MGSGSKRPTALYSPHYIVNFRDLACTAIMGFLSHDYALDVGPDRYFIVMMMKLPAALLLLFLPMVWPVSAGSAAPEHLPVHIAIPAGPFIAGSDAAEREAGYQLDEAAYGHSVTRNAGWYDRERPRRTLELPAYRITKTAITNAQYAAFIGATGHPAPDVDQATWKSYRLIHPFHRSRPGA